MPENDRDHVEERERDDHFDPDADRRREYDEWIDGITRRPWFLALEGLPGEGGLWVGTGNELMAYLRALAGDAGSSEGFPSAVDELVERPDWEVEYAFRQARLDVVDYRKLEDKWRAIYDAPGWGRKAPILVRKGVLAGLKPSNGHAVHTLLRYGNPLAIAVVLFTHGAKEFKRDREWSGRTLELAELLSRERVNLLGHPERSREVEQVLKLDHRPDDFRRFSGMMRTCAYILKEVGVKVSWEKIQGRNPISGEDYVYTLWTIKAPDWRP
jgi:hypothetical protein